MRKWLRPALLLAATVSAAPATAQAPEPFLPLEAVAGGPPTGRAVFFPLADGHDGCLPLTAPCLEGPTQFALVPAAGRRVSWTPEGTQLPERALDAPPRRAIGSPPPQPESARYLVPVLDGASLSVEFLPRRLEGDRLVATDATTGTNVVPVLAGPVLGGAGAADPPDRLLGPASVVDASELSEATPVLLVRRVPPARVVFAVRVGDDDVPVVDESGVAVLARHRGRVGLAAAAPEGFEPAAAGEEASADEGSGNDDEASNDADWLLPLGALALAGLVALAVRRLRRG